MKRSSQIDRVEQRFRQLCCLALDAPLIAPLLCRELNSVLPFGSSLMMWLGPDGPVDVYFDVPEVGKHLPLYFDRYLSADESKVWATPAEAMRLPGGPQLLHQVLRISPAAYFRHPLYNEVFLPSNVHSFIRLLLRDGGQPVATFTIARGPRERDFDSDDAQTMQRLEPFIVHAVAQRRAAMAGIEADTVEEQSALLVVDARGALQAASAAGQRLLSLSQGSMLAPPAMHDSLLDMIRMLSAVERDTEAVRVPCWRTRNAWGHFAARAYWLDSNGSRSVGIHLVRKVPLRLRLLEGLHSLGLPRSQEQVCMLLALGRSEETAARELGLSRNTIVYHRRQIYNRLGVDSRGSLAALLSRTEPTPSPDG